MTSAVAIANTALLAIGDTTIVDLEQDVDRARLINQIYDEARDATIRAFPWNFASRYLDFGAPLSDTPTAGFDFTYAFQLPSDPYVLRVLRPTDRSILWKVAGRELLTNESTFAAKCLVRVTDETLFDPLFREVFAQRLAAMIAWSLTKNQKLSQQMWEIYGRLLQEAYEIDSQEGITDDFENEALLEVRW